MIFALFAQRSFVLSLGLCSLLLVGSEKVTCEFITKEKKRLCMGMGCWVGSALTSQGRGAKSSQRLETPCEGGLVRTT